MRHGCRGVEGVAYVGEVEVGAEGFPHSRQHEERALRDLPQEEAHQSHPLVARDPEPLGFGGGLPEGLQQALLGVRVLQLDGADAPEVVQVAAVLHTGTKAQRHRVRKAERQKGRKAERQKGRKAERQKGRKAERQKGRKAERQKGE